MRVLIINPILYTAETNNIPEVKTIKDCMVYDLCLAFYQSGHEVTLCAAKAYKPTEDEEYPFEIKWFECSCPGIFMPHRLPKLKGLSEYIKKNKEAFDLIISSEVFSLNSLCAYRIAPAKLIVWHELALHNRMMKKIPSKIWYNFVVKLFMRKVRVVARSVEAQRFIGKYCKNLDAAIIEHGVNLEKFSVNTKKNNSFAVCSQLVPRKRVEGIIESFYGYLNEYDNSAVLYIVGDGVEKSKLEAKVNDLNIKDKVIFKGKLNHIEMQKYLSCAKALLINTIQDNSMISIVESIAVATPVVTTTVPLNSEYIISENLGIAKEAWNAEDLYLISKNNSVYVENCLKYREKLSNAAKVRQFIEAAGKKNN